MDLNYGINGSIAVEAARPVIVDSKTPLGFVVPLGSLDEMRVFKNPTEFRAFVEEKGGTPDSLAYKTANAVMLQGVSTKIVVRFVPDNDAVKDSVLAALDDIRLAPQRDDILTRPNIIAVPEYSYDVDVAAKMDSVAAKLKATAVVDVNAPNETAALDFARNFGSRFLLLYAGRSKAEGKLYPTSALIAGLIAYWDAGGDNGYDEFGYARSHSNRIVKGVSGSERPIEYFDGEDCEARRMRQSGIGAIVQDVGWRSYGFETTDIDYVWQSLERVRTFYRWLDAIIEANKWARDRSADQLVWVKKTCSEFFRKLTGAKIALGYEIYLDQYRSDVTAGKFTFVLKTANMPPIRELNFQLTFSDDWNEAFIEWINSI
ncbi:MAG: phage tail sheath family protein [Epsilonproteobacteria bacterium]|nr:phage tail sheath family protein [Campylobacterota bacterium]